MSLFVNPKLKSDMQSLLLRVLRFFCADAQEKLNDHLQCIKLGVGTQVDLDTVSIDEAGGGLCRQGRG